MKEEIESLILVTQNQRLRIYKVEGGDTFCIGVEGVDQEHFEFDASDAGAICSAIKKVSGGE